MKKNTMATLIGASLATALTAVPATASAKANPFGATDLASGYAQVNFLGGDKGEEGKCGAKGEKGKEGKCGEGKCGAKGKKGKEGKCGEAKCGGKK